MHLTPTEANAIATRIAAIEARTGVQVVTALVGRAARYPEARWKAFALGVSVAALAVVVFAFRRPDRDATGAMLGGIVAMLSVGATCALIATFVEPFARLFVRRNRAEVEVRQYAEGLFLERELYRSPARTAVLIVVSVLERAVAIHADRGFDGRIGVADWEGVVGAMTTTLRTGRRTAAIDSGLEALEVLLVRKGFVAAGTQDNVLPDRPIDEGGA
jgi:putative membrane protein